MTPTTITVIIASATLVLSIFGASWLNQQSVNRQIESLKETMNARFDAVNVRFEAVGVRLSAIEARIDKIERQLESLFVPKGGPR